MSERKFSGSMTMEDGRRVALSEDHAKALWEATEANKAKRAADMPTAVSALAEINRASSRLNDLGWRDAKYCPKDGSEFALCQVGSTGIWTGFYHGKWPSGHLIFGDSVSHPQGHFWKPLAELTPEETAQVEECRRSERAYFDRMVRVHAHD